MEILAVVIIFFIVFAAFLYLFKDKIKQAQERLPFKRREFLMNIPERKFFEGLHKIVPENYAVFPQVVLSNIVDVTAPKKEAMGWRNKINRKTIDFVLFEKPYYKPVLAIEYDGKTHNSPRRVKRDEEVEKILNSAGINIFHVKHDKNIDLEQVKNKIEENLSKEDS